MTNTRARATIRPMTASDVPAIALLEEEIFSDPWPESLFHGEVRRASALTLVAETDGVLVGYAICGFVLDEAHVENIAVVDAWRGQGVAQSLFDALLATARARGARYLALEVRAENARAIRFYERNGFASVAVRRGYYRHPVEDAIVMLRRLDAGP